jgi:tight adherence protein B
MGLVVGLGIGAGLLLIWQSFVSPRTPVQPIAGRSNVPSAGLTGACVAAALVMFVVVQGVSRTPAVSVVFAGMAAYLPVAVVAGRARRRSRELAEVWPDAVDNLASAVRAGMSLPEALIQLGERGPEPLRPFFVAFAGDYQAGGRFGDSLDRLKERLADPVGDRVVEGLRIAREVGGGDLGRLLRNLSGHLRDDARTRSELESRQSWTVNGARLAVAAPWLVLFTLSFQHSVISRYQSATGVVVLLVGALLCLLAYRVMLRIGRLPAERRVLS